VGIAPTSHATLTEASTERSRSASHVDAGDEPSSSDSFGRDDSPSPINPKARWGMAQRPRSWKWRSKTMAAVPLFHCVISCQSRVEYNQDTRSLFLRAASLSGTNRMYRWRTELLFSFYNYLLIPHPCFRKACFVLHSKPPAITSVMRFKMIAYCTNPNKYYHCTMLVPSWRNPGCLGLPLFTAHAQVPFFFQR